MAVASNPAATPVILEKLIRGSDPAVRLHVAANPSLTQGLTDLLLADPDPLPVTAPPGNCPVCGLVSDSRLWSGA